jgi:hypothetical protein
LGVISALLVPGTAIAAAVCVGSFVTSGIAAMARKTEIRDFSFKLAVFTGICTLIAPLVAALAAILAVISLPLALATIATRTGATIVHSIGNAIKSSHPEQEMASTAGQII